ncbi:MAG: amidohydrolase [Myxococcota bacterium]
MPPTILLEHPQIYLDSRGEATDALFVDAGRVRATGQDARQLAGPETRRIRPDGACVFPALADAHIHLWGIGQRLGTISLRGARHPEEVYRRLAGADPADTPHGWVLARDWDQNLWPLGETLSRERLDQLFPNVPVALIRIDNHAMWVNSEALRRAGLHEASEVGPDGELGRDASGRLTGHLLEGAKKPVWAAVPDVSEEEDEALFRQNARALRAFGVATGHMAYMQPRRIAMLERMATEGPLPQRCYCMIDAQAPELEVVLERGPRHDDAAMYSVRAIKFFADGALGSLGALMLDPYRDGSYGLAIADHLELTERIPRLLERGWQVAVHAIGDAGARNVLDAFAASTEAARRATRPRLEHAQTVHPEDMARFGELGVLASVQPIHMYSDSVWAHRVLHPEQLERLFSWRDLLEVTHAPCGSDFPIEDPNPWHGIATAVTRANAAGGIFRPEQAMSRHEALAGYLDVAAWAAHWEGALGVLHPGACFEAIALPHDPFACAVEELWSMQPTAGYGAVMGLDSSRHVVTPTQ